MTYDLDHLNDVVRSSAKRGIGRVNTGIAHTVETGTYGCSVSGAGGGIGSLQGRIRCLKVLFGINFIVARLFVIIDQSVFIPDRNIFDRRPV